MRMLTLTLAVLATLATAAPVTAATTKTVRITSSGFSPKTVTITQGDSVTWVNRDTRNHQILARNGAFVSPILRPGDRYSFTFGAAGTYRYVDELHRALTGAVVVKGPPPTLTLASSAGYVEYGTKVTLTGIVSSHKAGQPVTLYYQPYPQPSLIQLATVLTGEGGVYSFIVTPRILTTYQATWKGAFATPTTVQVRPRLTLGRNGAWLVHAYAGRLMARKAVLFQRLDTATGRWRTLRKVHLDLRAAARVSLVLPKGTSYLRLAMSVNEAGPGYLGAFSKTVRWRVR